MTYVTPAIILPQRRGAASVMSSVVCPFSMQASWTCLLFLYNKVDLLCKSFVLLALPCLLLFRAGILDVPPAQLESPA